VSQTQQETSRPGAWSWLPGVLLSILAIWLLSRLVTWQEVVNAVTSLNLRLLPIALVCYFIGMFLRAFAWRIMLDGKIPYWRVFFAMNEGYLLNNIFPLRLGELGRAVLLGRSSGLGTFRVLSAIVIERSYDMAISAGLLLATLPLALGMDWARPVAWLILFIVVAILVAMHFAARYSQPVEKYLRGKFVKWRFFQTWLLPKFISILEGFTALTDLRLFLGSLILLIISWGFAILENWVLLRSIVTNPPVWWAAFVLGVTALGGALPSVSGAVGVLEAAVVGALVVLKVNPSTALAYGIVLHIIHFVLSSLLGMIGLARDGENLSRIYTELRTRKT
jgi:uncharacterized protein (TIRG00374 family)